MRFKKTLLLIIALQILLCSCFQGGHDLNIKVSPTDKTLIDLASNIYTDLQLHEIIMLKGTIQDINAQYPIECLRESGNTYRASYLGDNHVAVVVFDNNGNKLLSNIFSASKQKTDFCNTTKGGLLEDVLRVDPNGEYLFLYAGRNDVPKVSSHYTKDGYIISIEYDAENRIVSITEELI